MACVQDKSVPISEVGFVAAHACEDNSSSFSLFFNRHYCFLGPIIVLSVSAGVFLYGYGLSWAEDNAALAVDAFFVSAIDGVIFSIVIMSLVSALVNAYLASNAATIISFYDVFRGQITLHCLFTSALLRPPPPFEPRVYPQQAHRL